MNIKDACIDGSHILDTIQSFIDVNAGDKATTHILIVVAAEIFDVSQDKILEYLTVAERE